MQSKVIQDNAHEAAAHEHEIIELQSELKRCQMQWDECEHGLLKERVVSDGVKAELAGMRRELELEREVRLKDVDELEREWERSVNLQSVLEDFQSGEWLCSMAPCRVLTLNVCAAAKEHETR